jgi:hypothetical protein
LRVEELLFPTAADARFVAAPFVEVLIDFARLLATCREFPVATDLLLGVPLFAVVLFFTEAFFAVVFFAVVFAVDVFAATALFFLGFFAIAFFTDVSIGGVTVAGATSTGPVAAGRSEAATVLNSCVGVGVDAASAESAENAEAADSEPIDRAAIVSPIAVRRMRRVTSRELRFEWERTGINLYFL